MTQTTLYWDRDQPLFARILHQIDFDVPRRKSIPFSIYDRKELTYTEEEVARYERARAFSLHWFSSITTCYLDELDKLVIITTNGLEIPNTPILIAHPIKSNNITTVTTENGEYQLITGYGIDVLHKYYLELYPDAQYWFALRDTKRPRTKRTWY